MATPKKLSLTLFSTDLSETCATEYELDTSTQPPSPVRKQVLLNATDMIGVLFVFIVFGDQSNSFLDFFTSVTDVAFILIKWFVTLKPVGVCFMIAGAIMPVEDVSGTFASLGFFIITLFFVVLRRNPFKFFLYCLKAWFVTVATTAPLLTSAAVSAIPQVPSASIVITISILSSLGVPTEAASLLYAVDWFLDRVRDSTVVTATMVAVAIIDIDAKKHKRGSREQDEGDDDEDDSVETDNVGLGSAARNKDIFVA